MIPQKPIVLLIFQLLAHLSIIPMIMFATPANWAVAVLIYFLTGCLGMTMTYHRLLSHSSWNPPDWVKYLFTLFATVGLTGTAIAWVAVHKMHHRYTDTDKDPHSPGFKGFFRAHFLSMYSPVELRYVAHLLRDKFFVFQHRYYYEINLFYAAVLYVIDPFAVIYAWLFPAMILWNMGSSIVSISHRNNKPHNDISLALLVWGEGYHENHHSKPSSSQFGKYDLAAYLIKLFSKHGV